MTIRDCLDLAHDRLAGASWRDLRRRYGVSLRRAKWIAEFWLVFVEDER